MNSLPPEILSQIFILLYQKDRVNCMTVCQAWEKTIKNFSLLETLNISTVDQFVDLMAIVEQDQILGLQTNRLLLDLRQFQTVQLQDFPALFPNVRTFYLTNFNAIQDMKDPRFQPWRDNLEVVIEDQSCVFTWHFLDSGTCSRLKRIAFRRLLKRSQDFTRLLKNAPNLQFLELTHIPISLQDLEILHSTVPLLKKLDMASVLLRDGDFPTNIAPASHITSVSFGIANGIIKQTEILQYVGKKYNKLVEFSLNDKFSKFIDKGYNVEMFNNAAFSCFFDKVHPTLRNLEISLITVPIYFLEFLDSANCQIQNLNIALSSVGIFKRLSSSNQAKYIQSLSLTNVGSEDYTLLEKLVNLKELRLSSKYKKTRRITFNETNLNSIICINSLEWLELDGFNLSCTIPSCAYPLKHLILESVVLPQETKLDDFLASSCPLLQSLKLFNCELHDSKNGHFSLPQHKFSYLGICDNFVANHDHMLLLGDNGQDCKIYKAQTHNINTYFHIHDNAVQDHDKAIPYSPTSCEPFITFECASVDTVVFLNAALDCK